ncbi:MAG TPA: hypothetical protein VNO52_17160 [Methylomirabilota bacterium]|nr:hypothetical protein [Methylomirabilota bacterium]
MTPKLHIDRIAEFVLSHLPDSVTLRRDLLEDLLVIVGEEHPLHGAIGERLSSLEFEDKAQLKLALQFRQRITEATL